MKRVLLGLSVLVLAACQSDAVTAPDVSLLDVTPAFSHVAGGAWVHYDDRALFDAAAPGLAVEDFTQIKDATCLNTWFANYLDATSDNICFAPGSIAEGITFSGGRGPAGFVIGANKGRLVVNTEAFTWAVIEFAPAVTALGLDVGVGSQGSSCTVEVYHASGLVDSEEVSCNFDGTFFGVVTADPITKVALKSNARRTLIGHVAFGDAIPRSQGDCKDGGWERYGFKNQGQCVRFVETGKDSR